MRLITARTVQAFAERHPHARGPLAEWRTVVEGARWASFEDIRRVYGSRVSALSADRVKFNIHGNDYRIIASIRWAGGPHNGILRVEFIGTHAEYDRVDALTVTWKR